MFAIWPCLHIETMPIPLNSGLSTSEESMASHLPLATGQLTLGYYIGHDEQNQLAEDMHQAVKYLSQELYSRDAHFLREFVQVRDLIPPLVHCI